MIWPTFSKTEPSSPTQKRMMRNYGGNPDVTVLKTGNKLYFKCLCGCEFVVSQRYCETELTGEFSFACPECKRKCLHE